MLLDQTSNDKGLINSCGRKIKYFFRSAPDMTFEMYDLSGNKIFPFGNLLPRITSKTEASIRATLTRGAPSSRNDKSTSLFCYTAVQTTLDSRNLELWCHSRDSCMCSVFSSIRSLVTAVSEKLDNRHWRIFLLQCLTRVSMKDYPRSLSRMSIFRLLPLKKVLLAEPSGCCSSCGKHHGNSRVPSRHFQGRNGFQKHLLATTLVPSTRKKNLLPPMLLLHTVNAQLESQPRT